MRCPTALLEPFLRDTSCGLFGLLVGQFSSFAAIYSVPMTSYILDSSSFVLFPRSPSSQLTTRSRVTGWGKTSATALRTRHPHFPYGTSSGTHVKQSFTDLFDASVGTNVMAFIRPCSMFLVAWLVLATPALIGSETVNDSVPGQWLDMERILKETVQGGVKSLLPQVLRMNEEGNISAECTSAFITLLRRVRSLDRNVFRSK